MASIEQALVVSGDVVDLRGGPRPERAFDRHDGDDDAMPGEEFGHQPRRLMVLEEVGQGNRHHRAVQLCRPVQRRIPGSRYVFRALRYKLVAVRPDACRTQITKEFQRVGHRQPRRKIARPRPIELGGESLAVAVRGRERVQAGLRARARPQESATLGGEQPLVAVVDVPVYAKRGKVQLELAGRVSAVPKEP